MDKQIELLTPKNSVLLMINYHPQMAFSVTTIDRQSLKNNTSALAKQANYSKCLPFLPLWKQKAFVDLFGLTGVDYVYTMVHRQKPRSEWKGKIVK